MIKCSKCGTNPSPSKHHIIPPCFTKGRPNNATVSLCTCCHVKIEMIYMSVECFVGNVPFGTRYRLTNDQYFRIIRRFLRQSELIHAEFR